MSSSCVCHTNKWCFYCEMFVPLKEKYELQNEAIEELTKELETIADYHGTQYIKDVKYRNYHLGYEAGLDNMIGKLKEVLANASSDTGNTANHE